MKFETSVHINDNVYTERVILKKKKKTEYAESFFFSFFTFVEKIHDANASTVIK